MADAKCFLKNTAIVHSSQQKAFLNYFLELNLYSFVLKKQRIGISKNFFPEILFQIFYRHRGDFYYDNTWTRFKILKQRTGILLLRLFSRVFRTDAEFRLLTKIDFNAMDLVRLCKHFCQKIANLWLIRWPPKFSAICIRVSLTVWARSGD